MRRPRHPPARPEVIPALAMGQPSSPRRATTSARTGPLTGREREVLGLLCLRLTDAEIAAALRISRRTASGHVTHILRKLRVPNRRQAAVVALTCDLR